MEYLKFLEIDVHNRKKCSEKSCRISREKSYGSLKLDNNHNFWGFFFVTLTFTNETPYLWHQIRKVRKNHGQNLLFWRNSTSSFFYLSMQKTAKNGPTLLFRYLPPRIWLPGVKIEAQKFFTAQSLRLPYDCSVDILQLYSRPFFLILDANSEKFQIFHTYSTPCISLCTSIALCALRSLLKKNGQRLCERNRQTELFSWDIILCFESAGPTSPLFTQYNKFTQLRNGLASVIALTGARALTSRHSIDVWKRS